MDVLFCPEASRREGRELPGASSPEEGDHCWTGWQVWTNSEHGQKVRERHWPSCRAYSAEVASATKPGSSTAQTRRTFSTLPLGNQTSGR